MNRFGDIDVSFKRLPPVYGYHAEKLVSIEKALEPIHSHIDELPRFIKIAKRYCHFPSEHGLSQDQSAAVYIYTMEWGDTTLYRVLNQALRSEDRQALKIWFSYLKLFDTALEKLPTVKSNVWRGVSLDIGKNFTKNQMITWWSVNSCSSSVDVIKNFLGNNKTSTLFLIEAVNGKKVSGYTKYENEDEVILRMGTTFCVKSNALDHPNGSHVVHLIEIDDNDDDKTMTSNMNAMSIAAKPSNQGASNFSFVESTCFFDFITKIESLVSDFREPAHDLRLVPGNTPTYVRTVAGVYKDILDYPQKYNLSTLQQSIRQALANFGGPPELDKLYDSAHHLDINEVSIKIYTWHSYIYVKLNEALRNSDKDVLLLFAPYIYSLLRGLQESKRHYYGVVYRGIGLESVSISTYRKNLLFYWPGFTSCTKDIQLATKWCGCTAVFIVNIPQRFAHACASIEDVSMYQLEKEVLLQPFTCFRILNDPTLCEYSGKTITKIELIIESTAYNLFGVWTCDDNDHNVEDAGTYFISQYGEKVFWFGRQHKAHWNFANVGYGTINNDHELTIQWGDLPIARDKYSGVLKLTISSDYQSMSKTYDSNRIFWGTNFRRISNQYLDKFEIDKNTKWMKADDLSGCWEGDDGSCYIIGTCNNQIFWLAIDKNNRWSHVGVGTYNNNVIKINWGDLIIGQDRLHGEIECKIISPNQISIIKRIHGEFLTKELTKKV